MSVESFILPNDQVPTDIFVSERGNSQIYIGTYDGNLQIWKNDDHKWSLGRQVQVLDESIRKIYPLSSGSVIVAGSKGNIICLQDNDTKIEFDTLQTPDGDPVEISALCPIEGMGEDLLAIGDDLGNVYVCKVSDGSTKLEVLMTVEEQDDSISQILYNAHKKTLVASSGDGSIVVVDLKRLKIFGHTTSLDDEIIAMAFNHSHDIMCGTGLGALVKFKWNYWGKIGNRLKPKLHARSSITAITAASVSNKQVLVTGTSDGILRTIEHEQDAKIIVQLDDSIEKIQLVKSGERTKLACICTNDSRVFLVNLQESHEDENEEPAKESKKKKLKLSVPSVNLDAFFKDL